MARIRFDFGKLVPVDLGEKCKFILLKMTGNAFFTTPSPTLAAVLAKLDELLDAITKAEQGSKADKKKRDDVADELIELLLQLGGYVTSVAGNKEQVLLSSGFDLESSRIPVGPLGQVQNVRTKTTGVQGEIEIRWKKLRGAYTYQVQMTLTNEVEASWKTVATVPRARLLKENVPSMQVHYFRIAGVGTSGQGPWSEIANGFAN